MRFRSIIDEAQMTYPNEKNPDEDTDLWNDLIKPQVNVETGARFCLFSCYGSSSDDFAIGISKL